MLLHNVVKPSRRILYFVVLEKVSPEVLLKEAHSELIVRIYGLSQRIFEIIQLCACLQKAQDKSELSYFRKGSL